MKRTKNICRNWKAILFLFQYNVDLFLLKIMKKENFKTHRNLIGKGATHTLFLKTSIKKIIGKKSIFKSK